MQISHLVWFTCPFFTIHTRTHQQCASNDQLVSKCSDNAVQHGLLLQDIREYELDYEAAKKTAAAAAVEAEKEEERRIKLLEKNPLGELTVEEEEDFNLGQLLAC